MHDSWYLEYSIFKIRITSSLAYIYMPMDGIGIKEKKKKVSHSKYGEKVSEWGYRVARLVKKI